MKTVATEKTECMDSNTPKNLLIISIDAAYTSPGIVFKTLIQHVARFHNITLMTQNVDAEFLPDNVRCIPLKNGVHRWDKAEKNWKKIGFNPRDRFWSFKTWLKHKKDILSQSYDAVIVLTSNGYYSALNLGKKIADRLQCRYIIYSVDGMPSPLPWLGGDEKLHRNISKELRRLCEGADLFISSNPAMMIYQKSILPQLQGGWEYLYTPFRPIPASYAQQPHEGYNILYAGSLYGLRRIDGLIDAFRRFLIQRPDAKLWFVGDIVEEYKTYAQDLTDDGKVIFKPLTDQIDRYYAIADCLIDIAADIADDVFLSGKIICYLPYKIPILAISGANSPVSQIMGGVPSIKQCHNDTDEIEAALNTIVAEEFDYSDRTALLEQFSPETIGRIFNQIITL